jgi:hypothetical protein
VLRVDPAVVGGSAGDFQFVARQGDDRGLAFGDGDGGIEGEVFAVLVLLDGLAAHDEIDERLRGAVEDRHLGPVHIDDGIVDAAALAAVRPDAVIVNVARGPVIDEAALWQALSTRRIGGAVIDTWYQYPTPMQSECAPSKFDFAALDNVLMTPHMSGWTAGTVRRRQETLAENIGRLSRGEALIHVVHGPG